MFNHSCAIIINGHHTDIVLNIYSDRILLIVTQFKKFGSFISVNRESHINEFNTETYSAKILFGKDSEDLIAASRYIAEQININKPLLLSISLKDHSKESLREIINAINKIKPW